MRIVMFYHSLVSDWNHGNAHFLRGIVSELLRRGHDVRVYEQENGWSVQNLLREYGPAAIERFHAAYPDLSSVPYDPASLDLGSVLGSADLVLVHEWNEPALVAAIGDHKRSRGHYALFFHDTHHRSVSHPEAMSRYDLSGYDAVLAFGAAIRQTYLRNGWTECAWAWHEAADTRIFHPLAAEFPDGSARDEFMCGAGSLHLAGPPDLPRSSASEPAQEFAAAPAKKDLVWIGNWADDERAAELREFLLDPVKELGLSASVYGVRYPESALRELADAGIEYGGWIPNFEVARTFGGARLTVHIPRRPYVEELPGIPTIRVFEALACGIPLVCSFWPDSEGLFTPGEDFLVARDGTEMKSHLRGLLASPRKARVLADHGRRTILARHTCAHRADELIAIYREVILTRHRVAS